MVVTVYSARGRALPHFWSGVCGEDPEDQLYEAYLVLIYRLSFPFMALSVAATFSMLSMFGVFRTWKVRIRDEAYLIGERLHNFGGATGARGAWSLRAGGGRL